MGLGVFLCPEPVHPLQKVGDIRHVGVTAVVLTPCEFANRRMNVDHEMEHYCCSCVDLLAGGPNLWLGRAEYRVKGNGLEVSLARGLVDETDVDPTFDFHLSDILSSCAIKNLKGVLLGSIGRRRDGRGIIRELRRRVSFYCGLNIPIERRLTQDMDIWLHPPRLD